MIKCDESPVHVVYVHRKEDQLILEDVEVLDVLECLVKSAALDDLQEQCVEGVDLKI